MRQTQARIADFWCKLMHAEGLMWPAHGQYECRSCGRRHRVCWEQALPGRASVASMALPIASAELAG
jgi:hypothetical protein